MVLSWTMVASVNRKEVSDFGSTCTPSRGYKVSYLCYDFCPSLAVSFRKNNWKFLCHIGIILYSSSADERMGWGNSGNTYQSSWNRFSSLKHINVVQVNSYKTSEDREFLQVVINSITFKQRLGRMSRFNTGRMTEAGMEAVNHKAHVQNSTCS